MKLLKKIAKKVMGPPRNYELDAEVIIADKKISTKVIGSGYTKKHAIRNAEAYIKANTKVVIKSGQRIK